jgi:NADPH2:quinone reductase
MSLAVIADQFGPPESYELRQFDPGAPGEGQVRVAIKAAGVSYVDVLTAMGKYQFHPPLPFIPGSEAAGVVEALGPGVINLAVGDRVFCGGMGGLFAAANIFNAASMTRIPDAMPFETAAIFPVNYQTAYYALADRGRAQPGETLLVLGAAGGTGFAAVQMGKRLGLRVIASASSPEKQAAALAGGADAVVTTGAADWREQVSAANAGKPIDIVFDPVGAEATDLAFRTLGYDGRHRVHGGNDRVENQPAAIEKRQPRWRADARSGVEAPARGSRAAPRGHGNGRRGLLHPRHRPALRADRLCRGDEPCVLGQGGGTGGAGDGVREGASRATAHPAATRVLSHPSLTAPPASGRGCSGFPARLREGRETCRAKGEASRSGVGQPCDSAHHPAAARNCCGVMPVQRLKARPTLVCSP